MNQIEHIKDIVTKLLENLDFTGEVQVVENEFSYQVQVEVHTDQSFLIGQGGLNLAAFQHILRLLCRKLVFGQAEAKEIHLDINGYWKDKEQKLSQEARERAQGVLETGTEYIFPPMESHDRKIIHSAVVSFSGVQTESVGTGRNRQVRLFQAAL